LNERTEMVLFTQMREMSAYLQKSKILPTDLQGKEADIFVTIMAGRELGLEPMAALRGIHVVKGKPVLSADTMVAVVLRSGKAQYFEQTESTNERATYVTKRVGSEREQRQTFTIEDARTAGLTGDNWRKYPAAMLRARAKAILARDVYPDVLAGCYEADEARDFAPSGTVLRFEAPASPMPPHEQVIDAEIQEASASGPSLADAIEMADSMNDLEKLLPQILALPEEDRAALRDAYVTRRKALKAVAG
jgi:hypothetical protein